MNKQMIFAVLFLIALLGCQTETTREINQMPPANMPPSNMMSADGIRVAPQPDLQVAPNGETKEFNVEAFQFGYEPNEIHVKLGDKVIIHLSTRDVSHSFTIPAFHVNVPANPGSTGTISFIADQKGAFRWFCSIPCGKGHKSMEGQLVVE